MIHLFTKRFVLLCALTVTFLVVVSFISAPRATELLNEQGSQYYNVLSDQSRLFNIDQEVNIPTWFVGFLTLYTGLLAGIIASTEKVRGNWLHFWWRGLAIIFVYISLDEVSGLHELVIDPIRNSFDLPPWLYQAWIVVGLALVGLFGLIYSVFLWKVPRLVAFYFILAGIVYVGGAVGVEAIGGYSLSTQGLSDWYIELAHIEEFMEMMGVVLAMYACTHYLRCHIKSVTILFHPPKVR